MKTYRFLWPIVTIGITITLILLIALPVFSQGGEENSPPPSVPPPTEDNTIPDTNPLANTLNPGSPNYNPADRYGPPGTRFGPPGKRGPELSEPGMEAQVEDHHYFGTGIFSGNDVVGVWAAHRVYDNIELNESEDVLYAPTLQAPNNCRLESVTSYRNIGNMERMWAI